MSKLSRIRSMPLETLALCGAVGLAILLVWALASGCGGETSKNNDCGAGAICGPSCGDGVCSAAETLESCASDCGEQHPVSCGNGVCDAAEAFDNCPVDCGSCGEYCDDQGRGHYCGAGGEDVVFTCPTDLGSTCLMVDGLSGCDCGLIDEGFFTCTDFRDYGSVGAICSGGRMLFAQCNPGTYCDPTDPPICVCDNVEDEVCPSAACDLDPDCSDCDPKCDGRECGSNSCGGECGSCGFTETCTGAGQCEAQCQPNCAGRTCGADNCGGSCGSCDAGSTCTAAGVCESQAPECPSSCPTGHSCPTGGAACFCDDSPLTLTFDGTGVSFTNVFEIEITLRHYTKQDGLVGTSTVIIDADHKSVSKSFGRYRPTDCTNDYITDEWTARDNTGQVINTKSPGTQHSSSETIAVSTPT